MASVLQICNLALARLGDVANVSSIDPPEGSVQAQYCAQFYPMVRDALLALHDWSFATKRASLAQLGTGWPEWDYAYAMPADQINILGVLPSDATDDYSVSTGCGAAGQYVTQPFSCEADERGRLVIYTDQADAVARYTARVTDTTLFSPLFTDVLVLRLAAALAGPILKGDSGRAMAQALENEARQKLATAAANDANDRKTSARHSVPWLAARA